MTETARETTPPGTPELPDAGAPSESPETTAEAPPTPAPPRSLSPTLRTRTPVSEETLRAASQAHVDARRSRLEAYADSLQAALDSNPSRQRAAQLEGMLAQARKDLHAASRSRVPQKKLPR